MPPDEVVFLQIVTGIEYIHSQNMIHRDIKPDNVLISLPNPIQIKISDLTFVKETNQGCYRQSKIRGTPLWMAPELLIRIGSTVGSNSELPDETTATDTFSTGCVLFYYATRGTHPFGKNEITVMSHILNNNPVEFISRNESKNSNLLYSVM